MANIDDIFEAVILVITRLSLRLIISHKKLVVTG